MKVFFEKDIHFAIQKHISVKELCTKYDCTEKEFLRHIRHLYKNAADDIIKKINQSAEKQKKPKNKLSVSESEPASNSTTEESTKDDEAYLLELKAAEIALKEDIYGLEIDYEDHAKVHRDYIRKIRTEKEEIDKLTSELRNHLECVKNLSAQNNIEVATMNSICNARREKKSDLDNIQAQIGELTRVKLYIEANGDIRVISGKPGELDNTGSAELANELFANPKFESYRIVAIKTAASVISVIKHLPVQAEVDFADDEVGLIFLEYSDLHKSA